MPTKKSKPKTSNYLENPIPIAAFLFLGFFFIYNSKLPTDIISFSLSDHLLTAAANSAVAQSPGYPLYTFLLNIFNQLPFFFNPAHAGHTLSAIFSSLALSLLFLSFYHLYQPFKNQKTFIFNQPVERLVLALLPTFALGLSSLYTSISIIAERYALAALLFSLVVFSVSKLHQLAKPSPRWLYLLALALGLGISHHWLFLAVLPSIALYFKNQPKLFPKNNLAVFVFLLIATSTLPFTILFSFQQNPAEHSYLIGEGYQNLYQFVAQDYLGDGLLVEGSSQVFNTLSLSTTLSNTWQFLIIIFSSLLFLLVPPFIFLFLASRSKRPKNLTTTFFAQTTLFLVVLAAAILKLPGLRLEQLELYPQLTLPLIAIVTLSWFGFKEISYRFSKAGQTLFTPTQTSSFLFVAFFIPIAVLGYQLFKAPSLKDYRLPSLANQHILSTIEPDAVLTCFSYQTCQSLIYTQQVNNQKVDATIVPFYYLPGRYSLDTSDLTGFSYTGFPNVMFDIITWNIGKRPVYSISMFTEYINLFGINLGFVNYIPYGYVGELTHQIPQTLPEYNIDPIVQEAAKPTDYWYIITDPYKSELAKMNLLNSTVYLKSGQRQRALAQANIASNIYHQFTQEEITQVLATRDSSETIQPSPYFVPGYQAESVDYITRAIQDLIDVGLVARALDVSRGAVAVDPTSVKARLAWANMLETINNTERAFEEYQNVLKLDPQNEVARQKVQELLQN